MDPKRLTVRVMALALCILSITITACNDDSPTGENDNNLTAGLPDFDSPESDWMEENYSLCPRLDGRGAWYAKFSFSVHDISADGTKVLLASGPGLTILDVASGEVRKQGIDSYSSAAWLGKERIVALKQRPLSAGRDIAVIDFESGEEHIIPLPSSQIFGVPNSPLLPGNSSVLVYPIHAGDPTKIYALDLAAPHAMTEFETGSTAVEFHSGRQYELANFNDAGANGQVELLLSAAGDTSARERHIIAGIWGASKTFLRISPDGRWLAAIGSVDLAHTRFHDFRNEGTISGLAIIDLRDGSPTQYKLYRFFPDYKDGLQHCSLMAYTDGGAFSPDGQYFYHAKIRRADSTVQLVRRSIESGDITEISDFRETP